MSTSRDVFQRWGGLGLIFAALVLYVRTTAPSVATVFDDSLEFQVVIPLLGVPHPPGYPLYVLLGKVWTWLFPVGDPAFRLNVLSAVLASCALVFMERFLFHVSQSVVGAWTAVVLVAIAPTFWAEATITEVYALHWLLLAALLYWGWRMLVSPDPSRPLNMLALVVGLGLAHHRMILLLVPTVLYWVWQRRKALSARGYPWVFPLMLALLPLLLYAYIPLVGARVGSLDGTYVNTWKGFWTWVSARAYGVFLTGNPFHVHRTGMDYVRLFTHEVGWVALGLAILGLYRAWNRGPVGRGLLLALTLHVVFVSRYRVADIEVFFFSVVLLAVPLVSWGIDVLWAGCQSFFAEKGFSWLGVLLLAGALVFSPLKQTIVKWEVRDRSDDWEVYDVGSDIVHQPLPPHSVIVGLLGETTLVRYFRDVLGWRPDLVTVPADREEERFRVVTRRLEIGDPVYITRPLPPVAARYALDAQGPLIRVVPKAHDPHVSPPHPHPCACLPSVHLEGYNISHPPYHRPRVRVTLYWDVLEPPDRDLKVSARLLSEDGTVIQAVDDVPVHNTYPTHFWSAGEQVVDVYDIPELRPASRLLVVLYDARTVQEVARVTLPYQGETRMPIR